MVNKRILILIVLLTLLSLNSCISVKNITIDQLEPGAVELPDHVHKIALISRNFKFSIDTLRNYWSCNGELIRAGDDENRELDSMAIGKILKTLNNKLTETEKFELVVLHPYSTLPRYTGETIVPLSNQFIKKTCQQTSCDAVLSLEMISYFYLYDQGDPGGEMPDRADVKINAIWAIYLPEKERVFDRFTYSDQIHWEGNMTAGSNLRLAIPPRYLAVKEASEMAATAYTNRLVPHWQEADRFLLSYSSADWSEACKLAEESDWDKAAEKWQSLILVNKGKKSSVAKYNYAVACEMNGRLDEATDVINQVRVEVKTGLINRRAQNYARFLDDRKLKIQKLITFEKPE